SINKVGMERSGFSNDEIEVARGVFKKLFKGDMNRSQAIEYLEKEFSWKENEITKEIIAFAQSSERGLA
ncbi:MAG: acyl-[acyl-carrier-protein]--UDP-N-acetylglucosamine O-acyltransferase, partial [Verrucomicrobiota bacterium]|nr:acyl-[acyl-carrier-protein]--UDP-N-acetylglucosamine O-acyltransferase [Verrucomicrobiota bacterium]